jgi:hypothetical protein
MHGLKDFQGYHERDDRKLFAICQLDIGSVGFDDHLIDSSLASIFFTSASFGCCCSAGAYQQIVKNMQKIYKILT